MAHIVIMASLCYKFEERDEADMRGGVVVCPLLEMNPIIASE